MYINEFVRFSGIICLVYLFVTAQPIYWIKEKLFIKGVLRELLDCCMCSGFWIGLIFYQDVLSACLVSVFSEGLYRVFNK